LIIEMLANVNLDHDLTIVAPHGRIVVVGNRGRVEIDARKIMTKDCAIYGLALWGIPPTEVARAHQAIGAGLATGALSPVVGAELPLSEASRAHVMVMEAGAKGKIVLLP
jgi:NADPH2:quinone reductase